MTLYIFYTSEREKKNHWRVLNVLGTVHFSDTWSLLRSAYHIASADISWIMYSTHYAKPHILKFNIIIRDQQSINNYFNSVMHLRKFYRIWTMYWVSNIEYKCIYIITRLQPICFNACVIRIINDTNACNIPSYGMRGSVILHLNTG